MTSSRMASSSRPMSSRSSGVRCRGVWCSWGGVLGSEVDLDRARRGGDARADHLAVGVLDVAGAQVAHGAGAQAPDAGVADAHATAVRQQRARLLAGHQQRRRRRPRRPPCRWPGSGRGRRRRRGPRGGDRAGSARGAGARGRRRARSGRSARPAGRPGRTPRSGAHASRARAGQARRASSGRRDRRGARAARSGDAGARARAGRAPKIVSSRDGATCTCATSGRPPGRCASARSMPMTGVTPLPAVTNSSGCSTASGSTNSPVGGASRTSMPAARVADEVLGHQTRRGCA